MRPSFRFPPLVAVLTLISAAAVTPGHAQTAPAAAAPAPATTYPINLSPPFKVGQKFNLVNNTTSDLDMTITVNAPGLPAPQVQHQPKQSSLIQLEGDCEVLAVTAEGLPRKLAVTVKILKVTQNGQAIPGLPAAGDIIIAERTGKQDKTFTVGGKPLSPEISKLLSGFIPVGIDGVDDQIMFGSKDPVAVGATWAPSPLFLANLQETLPTATGLQGRMKLESVQGSGDSLVATVSGNLTLVGVTAPLPPPLNTIPAQCTVRITGTFPTTAKGTFNESLKMDMKINGETDANGAQLKIDAAATQNGTQTIIVP